MPSIRTFLYVKKPDTSLDFDEIDDTALNTLLTKVMPNHGNQQIFGLQVVGNTLHGILVGGANRKASLTTSSETPTGREYGVLKTQDGKLFKVGKRWDDLPTKDEDLNLLLNFMRKEVLQSA